MTDPTRTCACGCGTPVTNKWARGHSGRGEGGFRADKSVPRVASLPPPDDPWWEEDAGGPHDLGELNPDPEPPAAGTSAPAAGDETGPVYEPGPVQPDPPPAHGKREWRRAPKSAPRKPTRVTAGIRNDIDAKIRFALQVPGAIWQARDPLCGGTFVQQIPDTAEAFTDIVCDSADLVAFFTGPGGSFMKFLKVGAALMPVVQVVAAHHVYHTVELAPADEGEQARYAA